MTRLGVSLATIVAAILLVPSPAAAVPQVCYDPLTKLVLNCDRGTAQPFDFEQGPLHGACADCASVASTVVDEIAPVEAKLREHVPSARCSIVYGQCTFA